MNFLNFSTNVTAIVTFCCSYDFFNTYIAIYIYISLLICLTGNTFLWMTSGDTSIFCSLPLGFFIMSSMIMLIGAKYVSG